MVCTGMNDCVYTNDCSTILSTNNQRNPASSSHRPYIAQSGTCPSFANTPGEIPPFPNTPGEIPFSYADELENEKSSSESYS